MNVCTRLPYEREEEQEEEEEGRMMARMHKTSSLAQPRCGQRLFCVSGSQPIRHQSFTASDIGCIE